MGVPHEGLLFALGRDSLVNPRYRTLSARSTSGHSLDGMAGWLLFFFQVSGTFLKFSRPPFFTCCTRLQQDLTHPVRLVYTPTSTWYTYRVPCTYQVPDTGTGYCCRRCMYRLYHAIVGLKYAQHTYQFWSTRGASPRRADVLLRLGA